MSKRSSKLGELLKLNLQMVPWYAYIFTVFVGIVFSMIKKSFFFDENSFISTGKLYGIVFLVVAVILLIFPVMEKICSETLYQKEAFFYQSFPVTSFETAFTKTVVIGILLAMMPLGIAILNFVYEDSIGIGLFLATMLLVIAFGFVSGGIILMGYGFGNSFKNPKTGKPNRGISYTGILILSILLGLLIKGFFSISTVCVEIKILWLSLVLFVIGLIFLFINTRTIKYFYEV